MAQHRRVVLLIAAVVGVVGATGGTVAYRASHDRPRLPSASAPPSSAAPSSPSATAAPAVERTPVSLAGAPVEGAAATDAGIARALAKALADKALGARVDVAVADGTTGAPLYEHGAGVAVVPASTAKLFTAAAALKVLGPDRRIETRVVAAGTVTGGVLRGDLVVVGGGDPTLTATPGPASYPQPARLVDLARQVRAAGITKVTGGLVVDTSLFATPGLGPAWKPTYVTEGSVAPVTAFEVDGGRLRPDDSDRSGRPDLLGGSKLRDALGRSGVVVGAVRRGRAPSTATEVASVESPPVSALVERLLGRSDNDLAEALARHVAIATGGRTDFAGSAAAVANAVRGLGVDAPALLDSSGLSPRDRVTPSQLVAVLLAATRDPVLAPVVAGLPVAGFTGTLATRYTKGAATRAAGYVRAKTGSLDNVATLAGLVETRSGRLLVFAFAADRLPTRFVGAAAKALDVAAAALASCGCAA